MQRIEVGSWEEFEERISQLIEERKSAATTARRPSSSLLYRGQANCDWHLETTLERYTKKGVFSLKKYYEIITQVKSQIETETRKTWEIPSIADFEKWLQKVGQILNERVPSYEYMVYLRHFGFPSPLLDWTRSRDVAAYFAFRDIPEKAEKVSIFVYVEYALGQKTLISIHPNILGLGHDIQKNNIQGHRRHFYQQSEYTVCTESIGDTELCYVCHEDAFDRDDPHQDLLWKFNIPALERKKVLKKLDTDRINAFSLFSSEESLMETLALREIFF